MSVTGIAHYNLRLRRDLMEVVRAFHVEVVGLRVGPRPPFATFGYWLYAGPLDVLHLSEERPDDPRRVGADLTFDHVALACRDLSAHVQRLQEARVDYTRQTVPSDGRQQLFFRDPAGNGVELIFPPTAP